MQAFLRHPALKAAATSCTMMAAGDVCGQLIQQQASGGGSRWRPQIDFRQTLRFAAAGLCLHGPFFYAGYHWLDRLGVRHGFDSRGPLRAAMMKTAIGQARAPQGRRQACLFCSCPRASQTGAPFPFTPLRLLQITLFPVFTCSMFTFLGVLEGLRAPEIKVGAMHRPELPRVRFLDNQLRPPTSQTPHTFGRKSWRQRCRQR